MWSVDDSSHWDIMAKLKKLASVVSAKTGCAGRPTTLLEANKYNPHTSSNGRHR